MYRSFAILFLAVSPVASASPNVLFIAVDDMRVELGCYGDTIVQSPHIDKLATQGTLFERAYCQQAVCNPSRASVLTGLRPTTLDIYDLQTHFRQKKGYGNVVTLPQAFKNSGYETRCIGKIFHNWVQDRYRGDARSWSIPAVMHYFNHGDDVPFVGHIPPELSGVPRTEMRDVRDNAYLDGRVADLAVETLTAYGKQQDKPFFLAVGFWKPHAPFNAPKKYWDIYSRSDVTPPVPADAPKDVPKIAMHDSREILRGFKDRRGGRPTPAEVLALRHGYYANISYVDAQVGRVLNALDESGVRNNTIVAFWSDHGFHLGEQSLWAKTSNFELDARVPMIIAAPEHAGNQRTDAVVELLDLYPTLLDMAELNAPHRLEGASLTPLLKASATSVKPAAFTSHPRPAYPQAGESPEAIGYSMRTDRYRYTEWRDYRSGELVASELYDHDEDPMETVNIVGNLDRTETGTKLGKMLNTEFKFAHPDASE